jgi:hypothetical protein
VDPQDMPTGLGWEEPLWKLYERMSNQWRVDFGAASGLDYGPAISVMQARGWDIDLGTELLRAIEFAILEQDQERRERK